MQQPATKKSVKKNWVRRVTIYCTLFLFPILYAGNAFANVYNVTDVTDGHATNQLRGAIEDADALGGTHIINVAAGTYVLTLGEIIFGNTAQNITIIGAGSNLTIISMTGGATRDRIFFINPTGGTNSPVISIQGIKFENGYLTSDPYGGAAICAGGGEGESLTVTDCIFDNNILPEGAYGGAAICMQVRGNLTVDNCTFTSNVSNDVDGGAVFFVVYNSGLGDGFGNLNVTNSTFTGNSVLLPGAPGSNGGAIAFTAQTGVPVFNVSITENTFLNNTADGYGGAIAADNSAAVSTSQVNYNRFVGNSSSNTATGGLGMNNTSGSVDATNNWWGCNNGPTGPGCDRAAAVGSGSGTLTATPYLQLKASATPSSICSQTPNNSSTIIAGFLSNSAGNPILPTNLDALIGLPISFSATLGTLSGAQTTIQASGTASVTFTSNGTPGTATVNAVVDNVPNNDPVAKATITVSGSPTISNQPDNTSVCRGSTATFAVTASGSALVYQWYRGATLLIDGPSGSGSTYAGATSPMLNISNTSAADNAADYNVHVSNLCGTAISNNASLTVNPVPVVTNPAVSTGTVGIPFSQTFTQTGGSAGTTFSTSSALPSGLTLSSAGVLSGTPTQSGTFPIVVKATDVTGCFGNGPTYNLVISACPVITVNNPAVTTGTLGVPFSQSFTQTGGTLPVTFSTASSLPPGLTLSGAGVLSGTPSQTGSYSIIVKVTDANGCTGTGPTYTLVISCPSVTVNSVSNQAVCRNTSTAAVNFSGSPAGTVFNWTNNNTSIGLAASGSGNIASFTAINNTTAPVTATITVTPVYTFGSSSCTGSSKTFTITVYPQMQMGACSKTDVTCNGGSNGSVSAGTVTSSTGTVHYTWKNASNVTVGTTPTVMNLPAGTYTLTVTDNCSTLTCSVTIGQPAALVLGTCSKTNVSCNGGSNGSVIAGTVSNAVGPVSYKWKNSSNVIVGTTPTVTGLPAGTYTLTLMDNCFTRTCTVTISQPSALTGGNITMSPNPTVAGQQPNTIFRGYGPQTVTLTASAPGGGTSPYTKVWSTGSTASSINVSPTTTTTYSYTITDANGCTLTKTFTVYVIDVRCGNNNNKVIVCHNGNELCISANAVPAHLDNHGDNLGPCTCANRGGSGEPTEMVEEEEPFKINVSPNPSGSEFKIEVHGNSQEPITVRITDITGRVYSAPATSKGSTILLGSNLKAGIYFAEVVQGKNRKIIKLVKLN